MDKQIDGLMDGQSDYQMPLADLSGPGVKISIYIMKAATTSRL